MNLPSFLIIGAMKAGTTSLYEDLAKVPGLHLSPEKEPEDLLSDAVLAPHGRRAYEAKFAGATPGDLCGEASTGYTKRPTYEGVAERALTLLGPDLKLIYMTREPVARMTSHYNHLAGMGREPRPIDVALIEDHTFLAYSRYDWQLAPWRQTFGDDNLLVIRFEDYVVDKGAVVAEVCRFLGVTPSACVEGRHRNASAGKHYAPVGSPLRRIATSRLYLQRIKPLLPTSLRDKIKAKLLPKTSQNLARPSEATLAELHRRLQSATSKGA